MGTGLGLPEVYGIVLSAGGSLRVEKSAKGRLFLCFSAACRGGGGSGGGRTMLRSAFGQNPDCRR